MTTFILYGRRAGKSTLHRATLRRCLLIALQHHEGVLANCALLQLGGLAGAW